MEQQTSQNAEGCTKTASDLERYRIVIERSKPDAIIECGTLSGMSALWFAKTAQCAVMSIDVDPEISAETRSAADQAGVTFVIADSVAPETADGVRAWLRGIGSERAMVVLDSDHSSMHVLRELAAYAGMVGVGCYCVVEDGVIRWLPEFWSAYAGGPLDAIEVWMLKNSDAWEIDWSVEDMFPSTQFPGGWLKRLRS